MAQYDPEWRTIQFVDAEYVKLPCREIVHFKTSRGIDQLLSPEHRVLLADGRVVTAEEDRTSLWLAGHVQSNAEVPHDVHDILDFGHGADRRTDASTSSC